MKITEVSIKEEHDKYILNEMKECRAYCALIHKARQSIGFNSVKYPITDVQVNRYFSPEYSDLIKDECGVSGYMDIKPVISILEFETFPDTNYPENYHIETDGERKVAISKLKSSWQDEIYQGQVSRRQEAEDRKKLGLNIRDKV